MTISASSRGALSVLILLGSSHAMAQAAHEQPDRTFILGLGGAGELEGGVRAGGNAMLEWEAISERLELEAEVSVFPVDGALELTFGLLAKKPFALTPWLEIMLGAGPEWVIAREPVATFHPGAELAIDVMLWPAHRFGVWIEPSYGFVFRGGVVFGPGFTAGAMVAW